MICIGVTGGIGSGKSTVCEIFHAKNIPVFYADVVASNILSKNIEVIDKVIEAFGNKILSGTKNQLDRQKLSEIVFQEPEKLEILNSIIHPKVFQEFRTWKKEQSSKPKYCLAEAALLFESGMDEFVDYILAVTADDEVRIKRTMERASLPLKRNDIISRMKFQMSSEEIKELSDFEIENNTTIETLSEKVNFFHIIFSTLKTRKEIE